MTSGPDAAADGSKLFSLANEPRWEARDGVHMRAVWGEGAMVNYVELEPGAVVERHSHPEEQIGLVVSGLLIFELAGTEHRLGPLSVFVAPGGMEHAARGGPEGAVVIDVFQPIRDDYREAMEALRAG